ncbi:MAG: phage terminase large subunit family protein [Pseudorhodobacter sp.]|nr:phage terminase large subunit family protein [Pseudorhodobacter sp.]
MGFLAPAHAVVARAIAAALLPPPPPDITRWCEQNIVFDERSDLPGPFRTERFEFLREIHETLSPEHPARWVTVVASAQLGKTESILLPTLAVWHLTLPLNSLVVQPTTSAAREFARNKWNPFRRNVQAVRELFGYSTAAGNYETLLDQETLDRTGSLKITSAGSPDDLAQTSRRFIAMDDVAKFAMNDKGDPEAMAESRAAGFEEAKILRLSTPQVVGTCRISKEFQRSDQRYYHVPCPHCGNMAPLTWENFRARIDPERLAAAHFGCEACGCDIEHGDKAKMVAAGKWVARNPRGDHPGFHIWRAYAPQRDWASVAVEYARVMGWSRIGGDIDTGSKKAVEAETEQTFWNDVLGLPYEQASKGPDWQALRDRAEDDAATTLPRGVMPACGMIFAAGVDCQQDRIEVQLVAFGRNFRRWVVDYIVIPHSISDQEGRDALDALLRGTWRTALGLRLPIDMLAIDSGNWTSEVWAWGKRHPWSRVILVKGASSETGPVMKPQQFYPKDSRKPIKVGVQKRAWMLNVSQLKADFYGWLAKPDPLERGFTGFARDLGDEYYRMVTAEVRVLSRARSGVVTSSWQLAEPGRRNEALDTMLYAEAAARRKGWASMTEEQWDQLDAVRGIAPPEAQADLFDASVAVVQPMPVEPTTAAPVGRKIRGRIR